MDDRLILAVPGHRIVLDVTGDGRAVSWQVDGRELLGTRSADPFEYGMYAMGPWAGRIEGNRVEALDLELPATYGPWALHGTVIGQPCRVLAHAQEDTTASATVEVDLGATWRRAGSLRAHWELTPDLLRTRLELRAEFAPFPGVIGWHPWFERVLDGARLEWTVDDARLAERDEAYRLTGRLITPDREAGTYDDAFRGSGKAVVSWPGVLGIEIANARPWFVVFDMLPQFVCVEPQSGPPNGVNDGLGEPVAWARPDQPLELVTEWRIRRAPQRG